MQGHCNKPIEVCFLLKIQSLGDVMPCQGQVVSGISEVLHSFKTQETIHPITQRHISEALNHQ
jgi:hypothetical protein